MEKRMVSARQLIGRKIVGFNAHPFPDGRPHGSGTVAHDPEIMLDDGTRLYFVVEETEVGMYGIFIGKTARKS